MPSRRSFLLMAAALPAGLAAASSREEIGLWPHDPPGGGGPLGPTQREAGGAVRNIAAPRLEVFTPARPNGAAVLVAAGGGYTRIENDKEAYPAAGWLVDQGVTAFVLTYRLPAEGWRDGPRAPLQDAQRAIRLVRASAPRRNLDPRRIGALGFSAGGHLIGLLSTWSTFQSYAAIDSADETSARPDFAGLIYPVVTLEPPYDRTSTRRQLIGDKPSAEASAEWSVQTHVASNCPPMFLAQADDDPISDPENTEILAEACRRAGVAVELRRFKSGGHGFAMGREGGPTVEWPAMWLTWLSRLAVLSPR
jgi:acetyl esterase/lipase